MDSVKNKSVTTIKNQRKYINPRFVAKSRNQYSDVYKIKDFEIKIHLHQGDHFLLEPIVDDSERTIMEIF